MQQVSNPFPLFLDLGGALLDAGNVYVGDADADPEVDSLQLYWDSGLAIPATQPLRTRGGVIVNNGAPASVYCAEADYSMRVRDADGGLVWYVPSCVASGAVSYQAENANLTAIAGLTTQSFGRSLLTTATAAAARTLLGITNWLSTAGGTMTGNIVRSGAGPHVYLGDGTYISGKITVTASGAADPTTEIGEIWIELE